MFDPQGGTRVSYAKGKNFNFRPFFKRKMKKCEYLELYDIELFQVNFWPLG